MKRILILILVLTFIPSAYSQVRESGKSIRVMSYNIHYGRGMDERYDLERIAEVIVEQAPDIVGLQEIGASAMAERLGELTGMNWAFGPSKEDRSDYGDAVLSKHPFEWVGNYSIPSASSSRYQVMGVDVDLSSICGPGTKVRFINTHFDWLPSIGSQEARLAAVDVIERAFFESNAFPAVLTGDLNAEPGSPPLAKLIRKGWVSEEDDELLTSPAGEPRRQIDYVLVRPEGSWEILNVEVIEERIASDHLPIVMTVELNK